MASSNFNDFVSCPYDKTHNVLRGRLLQHLDRCSRNSNIELKVCPFNDVHRFPEENIGEHIKVCPDRASVELFKNKEKLPGAKAAASIDVVKCDEDWDKDPDVPTYNPNAYCEENLVIRSNVVNGQPRSVRRNFRESERRRFADKQ
ncbi:gametocyte-specific factor 1 homolog [Drosophila mojavensis]|uniref:CHHC U11-48K-type domain-containing protein n=1 Tax=Drosophila mojavensis TaxID=7230 RepID=B4KZ06_DROMO|nr:gametocyte-specific factor 1 homolog [Drosophila mojavensis]EDW18898.1 uncharacterized protein Dmoj_GI13489 [Drosophila mojavensis]